MHEVDAVVVGGGVIGLAIGRELAVRGLAPLILERESHFGAHTSSRNSEVIHAGLYYPPGSLRAGLCVKGRDSLYAYCKGKGVPHRRIGKLVIAFREDECAALNAIHDNAIACGVNDLITLDARQTHALEPELGRLSAALLSPSTGIIDSHAFMLALLGDIEAQQGQLVCDTGVARAEPSGDRWRIWIEGESEAIVETPILVNAAGLGAQTFALASTGLPHDLVPPLHLARGVYYSYSGRIPLSRLIYPMPEKIGVLGVHLTLDLGGQARFGPDLEWVDRIDYSTAAAPRDRFVAAAQRICPGIDPDRLHPGYAGIRPKLSGPGEIAADFVLLGPAEHGQPGLFHLFGIESPGLTSSLVIAETVADALV